MADNPPGQSCESCRYYLRWDEPQHHGLSGHERHGSCRRYPPTVTSSTTDALDVHASVASGCWCGEYACANPETVTDGAATLARLVLLGDLTAARALADKLRE